MTAPGIAAPEISVVVPTFRRPELLARCMSALRTQDLEPWRYEIVVADDSASDATRAQVQGWQREDGVRVHYVPVRATQGPAGARNAGWRIARGAVIAFTDDDTVPDRAWLREGLAALTGDRVAVTGTVVMPLPDEPSDYERNESGLTTAEFVTANCFVRRVALEAVGGFDERFTAAWREDSDLQFRLLRHYAQRPGCIGRARRAVVVHPVRPAPWGVSLSQQRKSVFDALLYKKHPDLYRRRIRRTPLWEYYLNVGALALCFAALVAGRGDLAGVAASVWLLSTAWFCARRLSGTSHAPRHVAEMIVTSVMIPPLSLYWRALGAWRYRVLFL